jgi:MFS family permease
VLFALLSGTVMWGCNTWLPLFVQGAQGATPLAAGWAISPMSLGWPIASTLAGRLMLRIGYERVVVLGGFALVLGTGLLVLTARLGAVAIGIDTFVIGVGMGFGSTPLLITIQNAVEWSSRGAVTALNQFARTIGGAVGVSLMGVLVAARLGGVSASELAARIQPGRGGSPQLATAVEPVFWTLLTLGAASLAVAAGIVAMRRKWAR